MGRALSGLERTGRAPCTYQGSCDRTHSVFLVLLWRGMDLEKQKDWATDMYELLKVKWEPFFQDSFIHVCVCVCGCVLFFFSPSHYSQWSRCKKEARDSHNSRWTRVHLEANPAIKVWVKVARHRINNSLNYEANKTRKRKKTKQNRKKKQQSC